DLRRLAQYLAGYRIDASAGPVPLEPAAAHREGHALRQKYPAEFVASPAQVLGWHGREAEDAERAHEWSAALPHLAALVRAEPPNGDLRHRRARAYVALGQWEQALPEYAGAMERDPHPEADAWYQQALQVGATVSGGEVRLQWQPLPSALGYHI